MTSQSPTGTEATDEYEQAWMSIQEMTRNHGISWSGRESNHLFLNAGDGWFCDVSGVSGADFQDDARAAVPLDWDGDGRLDLLLRSRTAPRVRLMRNQGPADRAWVAVHLTGVDCNRDAIGARVTVHAGGVARTRTLYAGDGYLAQSPKTLHFGLGDARTIDAVEVRWPGGAVQKWTGLEPGARYHLVQGQADAKRARPATDATLASAATREYPRVGKPVRRIPLIEKIPIPHVPLPAWSGGSRHIRDLAGAPTLINLWGVDCTACLAEFGDFQEHADALTAAGLRIVPLNTDAVTDRERAEEMLDRFDLSALAGSADPSFLAALEATLFEVVGAAPGTPLPTSLLLDERAQLCVVYQGRVDVDQLLADVATLRTMNPAEGSAHALHGGRRLMKRHRNWTFLAKAFRSHGLEEQARLFDALASRTNRPR